MFRRTVTRHRRLGYSARLHDLNEAMRRHPELRPPDPQRLAVLAGCESRYMRQLADLAREGSAE